MRQAKSQFITGKPVRIPKALREDVEAAIQAHLAAVEKLTAVLDKADGDPDLEPALGSRMGYGGDSIDQRDWAGGADDDREGDVADEPHDEDDEGNNEPSLAHTADLNQERAQRHLSWPWSPSGDLEAEHDGREPEAYT